MTEPTTTPLAYDERQARIDSVERMTPAQASYIADLVDARFAPDAPEREEYRQRWNLITKHAHVSALIEDLKAIPTLQEKHRAAVKASQPTEEGLYRNPETGELYRLKYSPRDYTMVISKYSKTGGPRRLVVDLTKIVSGKWNRMTAFNSRVLLSRGEIKKDWKISAQELATEYAYGYCPLHNGPLSDGVSVELGYGKDCAEKHGLPWSEEAAQASLAARLAAQKAAE